MPRQKLKWFRCYSKLTANKILRREPPAVRWVWITILCLASESPTRGHLLLEDGIPVVIADIVDAANVPLKDVKHAIDLFMSSVDMLHQEGNIYVVTKWKDNQFESDTCNDRVQKWRDKKRSGNGDSNDEVTLHVTDLEHCNPIDVTLPLEPACKAPGERALRDSRSESRIQKEDKKDSLIVDRSLRTPREEKKQENPTINDSGLIKNYPPSRLKDEQIQLVIAMTGDHKSASRFRQLYGLCDEHAMLETWDSAFSYVDAKIRKGSAKFERPGAYFCTMVKTGLESAGVIVPAGSDDERKSVQDQIKDSLTAADVAMDQEITRPRSA